VRPEHEVEVAARALRGHGARLAVVAGAHVRVGLLHDAQVRDAGEARGAEGAVEEAPEAALVVGRGRRARLEDAGLCEHLRLRTGGRREQGGCCEGGLSVARRSYCDARRPCSRASTVSTGCMSVQGAPLSWPA